MNFEIRRSISDHKRGIDFHHKLCLVVLLCHVFQMGTATKKSHFIINNSFKIIFMCFGEHYQEQWRFLTGCFVNFHITISKEADKRRIVPTLFLLICESHHLVVDPILISHSIHAINNTFYHIKTIQSFTHKNGEKNIRVLNMSLFP